jgi:hypothetical protein
MSAKRPIPSCDRCFEATNMIIMSKFNTQDLCEKCKRAEEAHPGYAKADEAEFQSVKAGERNFPGIGLPSDLREKMVADIIKSNVHKELLFDAVTGLNDGMWEIMEDGPESCSFCKERLVKTYLEVADVDEQLDLCPKCGLQVLSDFHGKVANELSCVNLAALKLAQADHKELV